MKVACIFDESVNIVHCPVDISDFLGAYQQSYFKWLNEEADHLNVFDMDLAVEFSHNAEDFCRWLNTYILNDFQEKAYVEDARMVLVDSMPMLYF